MCDIESNSFGHFEGIGAEQVRLGFIRTLGHDLFVCSKSAGFGELGYVGLHKLGYVGCEMMLGASAFGAWFHTQLAVSETASWMSSFDMF